jgi:hypothetical protein
MGGSPKIFGNTVYSNRGQITVDFHESYQSYDTTEIYDNIIAYGLGFSANSGNVSFTHNLVLGCGAGCALYSYEYSNFTIQNNTIVSCGTGISSPPENTTIKYNNIQNSSLHSFVLDLGTNFDATYNWWGTTDIQTINQSISDFKDHYLAGNVTFFPFLEEPNPQAPSVSSYVEPQTAPAPAQTPTTSPTQPTVKPATATPTQTIIEEPWFNQYLFFAGLACIFAVIVIVLVVVTHFVRDKKKS